MSENVIYLRNPGISADAATALRIMDSQITAAINAAIDAGVPQGLIVGILHGYAHFQTANMMGDSP